MNSRENLGGVIALSPGWGYVLHLRAWLCKTPYILTVS